MSQAAEKREQKLLEKEAQKQEQKQLIQEVYASEGLKKPPLKENRSIAKAVLAIAVALSILVIAPVKLNAKRNSVIKEFKNGTESKYTVSVYTLIRDAAAESQKMKSAMQAKIVPQDIMDELQSCINEINSESDPEALTKLNTKLVRLTNEVYETYKNNNGDMTLTGIESGNRAVKTLQEKINNIEYWDSAEDYNSARGSFPGNLLGSIYSIDYVPDK